MRRATQQRIEMIRLLLLIALIASAQIEAGVLKSCGSGVICSSQGGGGGIAANDTNYSPIAGSAIPLHRPVLLAADGKVYPYANESTALSGTATFASINTTTGLGGIASARISDSRYITLTANGAQSIAAEVWDVSATGTVTLFSTTSVTTPQLAENGEFAISVGSGGRGVAVYKAGGYKVRGFNVTSGTVSWGAGESNLVNSMVRFTPILLRTSNPNKFIMAAEGTGAAFVTVIDASNVNAPTPISGAPFGIVVSTSNWRAVHAGYIDESANQFWALYSPNSGSFARFANFRFNDTNNTITIGSLGSAESNLPNTGVGPLFDVKRIYEDSNDVWLALVGSGATQNIRALKVSKATGAMTNNAVMAFTGDNISGYNVAIAQHKVNKKFLVSWAPDGFNLRTAEYLLNTTTGDITLSTGPFTVSVPDIGANNYSINVPNDLAPGFIFAPWETNQGKRIGTVGTYGDLVRPGTLIGVSKAQGFANSPVSVALDRGVVSGLSGLTPGPVSWTGSFALTPTVTPLSAGVALSTTELQVKIQ
ncbi:MAG: hypothetical protein ACRCV9_05840 [Burkholderiaceae bacterium]